MGFFGFIGFVVCAFIVLKILRAFFDTPKNPPRPAPIVSNGLRIDGYYVHRSEDEDGPHYDMLIFGRNYAVHFAYHIPIRNEERQALDTINYLIRGDEAGLQEAESTNRDIWCKYLVINNRIQLFFHTNMQDFNTFFGTNEHGRYRIQYDCRIGNNELIVDCMVKDEYDRTIYQEYSQAHFRFTEVLIYR